MAEGTATIALYCDILGADLKIVDVGIAGDRISSAEKARFRHAFADRRVALGTRDIAIGPAMTNLQLQQALAVGYEEVCACERPSVLVLGDMGIGNTTICSALVSAALGIEAEVATGAGSGVVGRQREVKIACVRRAVERVKQKESELTPMVLLRELGGLEVAAIVGALLAAADRRIPVIIDGLIITTAYFLAQQLVRGLDHLAIFGSKSGDSCFELLEGKLSLNPILNLGMRLGEGTAAVLCYPLLRAAAAHLQVGADKRELMAR